ncbi:MAG: MFS transporter, partial [Gammaproteobacteria bacterium]
MKDEAEQPSLRYAWYVIGVLFLAYTFSYLDRQILALLVKPVRADLALSDTQFSLLVGLAFGIFYTLMGLPLGRM